ncbi:hypothetical protein EDB83DRAFT_2423233 [Lactarius deliciosus]|nr:hypothetical protein EDB83DRAFT_2470273 [Lactarius deliciosus]KAH9028029.1 hypothetical protein EDB83DRAFT_2423233 [Lactarius deliciosus]
MQNGSPQKVDFTARYKRTNRRVSDELEEYFKLGQEDFETCRPLDWWLGRRAQFPNLYRLFLGTSWLFLVSRFHFLWLYTIQGIVLGSAVAVAVSTSSLVAVTPFP